MGWVMVGVLFAIAAVTVAMLVRLRRRVVVIDVRGISMAPTLNPGDRVLVRRVPLAAVSRGAIVVMAGQHQGLGRRRPSARLLADQIWVVKRVVAVPGDPVPPDMSNATGATVGTPVPSDRFLVMGDNSSMSSDSRMYGFVSGERLLGVVTRRLAQ